MWNNVTMVITFIAVVKVGFLRTREHNHAVEDCVLRQSFISNKTEGALVLEVPGMPGAQRGSDSPVSGRAATRVSRQAWRP